jgi:hypothetical protein
MYAPYIENMHAAPEYFTQRPDKYTNSVSQVQPLCRRWYIGLDCKETY